MEDRVDILMGTYNGEKHVEEQINSLLNQTYQNFQLIIGDDASTDHTRDIISKIQKEHPSKIMFLPFSDNVGALNNFTRLAEFAESNYVMFCDQDDIWFPDKIEHTLKKMKELENTHGSEIPLMVFTDAKLVTDDLKKIHPSLWKYSLYDPVKSARMERLLVVNCCTGCTMMVNKNLLDFSMPVPPLAKYHDHWIAIIAATFGKIGHLDEPTLLFRRHQETHTQTFTTNFKWFINFVFRHPSFQDVVEINIGRASLRAFYIYRRYSGHMTDKTKELYEALISLKDNSFIKEVYLRFKYGFFSTSFWWNTALLYGSFRMGKIDKKYSLKI